jgi:hypothetical protein
MQPKEKKMSIPEKVSKSDLIDAFKRNRKGIDNVEAKLDLGPVSQKDLEDLAMFAGRTSYLCWELIRWQNFQMQLKVAAKREDAGLEWE